MKGSVSPESTPERALAHDERCEQRCRVCHYRLDDFWHDPLKTHAYQPDFCACAERALAAARQREEEAKGEITRWKADLYAAEREADTLRAENDRLTLAASESARTLQVEIERLKAAQGADWRKFLQLRDENEQIRALGNALADSKNQVTALREAIGKGMNAPSGTPICLCHNHNAVLSQRERPCWYCEVRAVLAEQGWASFHASEETAARVILERNRYQMALQSIAANTCCDRCQEAALVAAAALAAHPQDGA